MVSPSVIPTTFHATVCAAGNPLDKKKRGEEPERGAVKRIMWVFEMRATARCNKGARARKSPVESTGLFLETAESTLSVLRLGERFFERLDYLLLGQLRGLRLHDYVGLVIGVVDTLGLRSLDRPPLLL